jgi:hypothetical protein
MFSIPGRRVDRGRGLPLGDGLADGKGDVVPQGARLVGGPFGPLALPPGDHGIPQLFQAMVRGFRLLLVPPQPEQVLDGATVAALPSDVTAVAPFGVLTQFVFACHDEAPVLTQYTNPPRTFLIPQLLTPASRNLTLF